MAFPPKKSYPLKHARPPGSPEPGDKPNNTRTFDARPKPIIEPGRYEPRRHAAEQRDGARRSAVNEAATPQQGGVPDSDSDTSEQQH
jgi:hypothetical protein